LQFENISKVCSQQNLPCTFTIALTIENFLVRVHKKLAVRSVTPSHVPLANILKSQLYGDCT